MTYVLDTNFVSELIKDDADVNVLTWAALVYEDELYISVGTLTEIRTGIELLPRGKRRTRYEEWLVGEVIPRFAPRTLTCDAAIADLWARFLVRSGYKGGAVKPMDSLIAATAAIHGKTVITRNVDDFTPFGVPVLNPWDA